ncbi:MAG: tRNA-(ms[2]io[6]A)-hydroxylase [Pseudomonadota bacterium]|nr:tRNA-(ms[2]io[6]A)-hydroxylase [Pseudomonadota bacterium]
MIPLVIAQYLRVPTPEAWIKSAISNADLLLIDHANCEKKAASTALSLLYRYVEKPRLLQRLSRLAREELRHFEQVARVIEERGVAYRHVSASRYAGALNKIVRSHEPQRLVDTLLVASVIEARSCERFALLADVVDEHLAGLYRSLLDSEKRHFDAYRQLALEYGDEKDVQARLDVILEEENDFITTADQEFRFHSGPTVDPDTGSKIA